MAAEKYYEERGQGKTKKEYVTKFIQNQGFGISEEQLSILIDAIVEDIFNMEKNSDENSIPEEWFDETYN